MTSHSWNTIPVETLRSIYSFLDMLIRKDFDYATNRKRYQQEAIKNYCACQLVCKDWSKEAQKLIYMEDIAIGTNISALVNSMVKTASHPGASILKVTITSEIHNLENPLTAMETLFTTCRKIRCITVENFVLPVVLMEDVQFSNLLELELPKDGFYDSNLYMLARLKFKKTLSTLMIDLRLPEDKDKSVANRSKMLLNRLDQFESLSTLKITQMKSASYKDLDQIIDKCPTAVTNLIITRLDTTLWNNVQDGEDIRPANITCLKIEELVLGDSLLDYIIEKFEDCLDQLITNYLNFDTDIKDEELEFLDQLCGISWMRDVSIALPLGKFALSNRIQACLDCVYSSDITDSLFTITYIEKEQYLKPGQRLGIQFSRTYEESSTFELVLLESCTWEVTKRLPTWLKKYPPWRLVVYGIQPITTIYKLFLSRDERYYHIEHKIMPYFDVTNASDIKYFLAKKCNHISWINLYEVLWGTVNECLLSNFILMDHPPAHLKPSIWQSSWQSSMRSLSLTACIIHHDLLPVISSKLPALKFFLIEATTIFMEEPYTLKIFLPYTELEKFALNTAPLIIGTQLSDKESTSKKCALENQDLLKAFSSPTGRYTLKIETDALTRMYKRQEGSSEEISVQPDVSGSEDDFLIWIKCKDLGFFSIARDDSMDRENIRYEKFLK
ncbi:hypothetical protein MBANPS3_000609 [Mucor bainieri]